MPSWHNAILCLRAGTGLLAFILHSFFTAFFKEMTESPKCPLTGNYGDGQGGFVDFSGHSEPKISENGRDIVVDGEST